MVRFFTILLIVYSIYQLSFTWFVRSHEKKLEAKANSFVKVSYPSVEQKYPGNKDSQEVYREFLNKIYLSKLDTLKKESKDVTLTYGITGAISYQKAKEEELNLGLDLQGGMNVTMEVEMTGLLKTLSNNSRDITFLKAIESADKRKANSDANFVTLFAQEYEKLNPSGRLASLFSAASGGKITLNSSNQAVRDYLNSQAEVAFDNNLRVLTTRIDQFGVAQPNINPDKTRGIINVELPGIQDKERVRKYLQSSANLQFWEVYSLPDIGQQVGKADEAFFAMMGGKTPAIDTAAKTVVDTTGKKSPDTSIASKDTLKKLGGDEVGKTTGADTGKKLGGDEVTSADSKKHL
ncbi:MAG TPA: protein translocase subunit SecDF, partial [Chitinophagaceae bacterium]